MKREQTPSSLEGTFQSFTERLTLSTAEREGALSRGEALAAALAGQWPVKRVALAGALARGTAPAPITSASIAFVMDPHRAAPLYRERPDGPARALEDLERALQQHAPKIGVRRASCSLVWQTSPYPIRVLPVFEDSSGVVFLGDRRQGRWWACHHSAQLAYLMAEDQRLGGQARSILTLLNVWRRHHGLPLHTLHLEIMALSALKAPPSGLAAGLFNVLQRLPGAIHAPCHDPTQPEHRLDAYLAGRPDLRDQIADVAYTSALNMNRAIDLDLPGTTSGWAQALAREVLGLSPNRRPSAPAQRATLL